MSLIIPANTLSSGGYTVDNSLRFNSGSSDKLVLADGTPTNALKWTYSTWVKRSALGGSGALLGGYQDGNNWTDFYFSGGNALELTAYIGSSVGITVSTNALFRDVSAWYHIVLVYDSANGTASNRVKIYVNGVLQTINTATYPNQNYATKINANGVNQNISFSAQGGFNGYMSEVCFIDGQALDPTSFGEFDSNSGIWKPIDVSGLTFGNNGFYLDFEDSSALGNDAAGSNNFTVNNLTAIDQTTDTPTNNFCTLNPLDNYYSGATFSEGNLKVSSARYAGVTSTFALTQGKWYFEYKCVSRSNTSGFVGITSATATATNYEFGNQGGENVGYSVSLYNGSVYGNGGQVAASGTFAQINGGDFGMVALDFDNNKMYFGRNGTWGNSQNPENGTNALSIVAVTQGASGHWRIYVGGETSNATVFEMNFGNPPYAITSGNTDGNDRGNFEYAPPSGYLSLCTANLSESG